MPHVKVGPPSLLSQILSVVLEVFGIVLIAVVGGWFAWQAGKFIISTLSRWWASLGGKVRVQTLRGYVDEVESLDGRGRGERLGLRKFRRAQAERTFDQLSDPRDRVRYLYQKLLSQSIRSGFTWSKSDTPLETIKHLDGFVKDEEIRRDLPRVLKLYHLARYSRHEIDGADLETMRRHIENANRKKPSGSSSGKLFLFGRSGERRR